MVKKLLKMCKLDFTPIVYETKKETNENQNDYFETTKGDNLFLSRNLDKSPA
jgi:hypothetical protein